MSKHPEPIDHQHYDHETASSICTFPITTLDEAREAARQLAGPSAEIVHRYLRQQQMKQTHTLSPAAQAPLDAYGDFEPANTDAMAAAIRAAADQLRIDMTATACINHLYRIAAELESQQ